MVLYLYVTDIYEDEPLWVYAATMLWGALAGVVYGLACAQPTDWECLWRTGRAGDPARRRGIAACRGRR